MSASTVSITANPGATARRRPKQVAEVANDVAISLIGGGAGPDKLPFGGTDASGSATSKDLSHSIRGEAVLLPDRSEEPLQVRKPQSPSSAAVPLRKTRKAAPTKPRWQTVLSVFTKNFMLLLVLFGLVRLVRKMATTSTMTTGESPGSQLLGFTDMEGRIAEVDSLLKSATKMLQVQIDALDNKLDGELGDLRREIGDRIEESNGQLEIALRKMDERGVALSKDVADLSSKDFLTRDDFASFYEELRREKLGALGQKELTLDEISSLAREIIKQEVEKHAADGLGRVDFALASGGARVVKHSEPLPLMKGSNWLKAVIYPGAVHEDAEKMLTPSFGEPGQCFGLKGSSGFVEIRLNKVIVPEAVTLEHVAKNVAYDRSSAPKDCKVSGWLEGSQSPDGLDSGVAVDVEKIGLLTEFTYDLEKSNAQTFNVLDSAGSAFIDTIRFEFSSNHGNPSFTCVYRLRVHGVEAPSLAIVG